MWSIGIEDVFYLSGMSSSAFGRSICIGAGVVCVASAKQLGEGAGGGATGGAEAGDVGFGELAGGAIGDRDIEVKWSCPCEEFFPGGGCLCFRG